MTDTLQLVIVTTAAAGALAVLTRPLWLKRPARPAPKPASGPGCDKCSH